MELKAFLIENFDWLSNNDYIKVLSNTLGIYEHSKPKDLEKLLIRIETQVVYLEKYSINQERPLFWVLEEVSVNEPIKV